MGPPSAAVGYSSDFLNVEVDLMTWAAGDDLERLTVAAAVGIDESAALESQLGEVAGHGTSADRDALAVKLEGNSRCRPLPGSTPMFNLGDSVG